MKVKKILDKMLHLSFLLSEKMTEQNEFVIIDELQKKIKEAKEVFSQRLDKENQNE